MKIWSVLLLTVILILAAGCATATEFGFCGENLYYIFNDSGNLEIGVYKTDQACGPITKNDWSSTIQSGTTSVEIKDGVTGFDGTGIFYNFTKLTSVTLPSGMKNISDHCFNSCLKLKTINIPDSVQTIDQYAFRFCNQLSSITLPDTLHSLGEGVFDGCFNLSSANIPAGLSEVPDNAFAGCESLKSITIPSGIKRIGINAFLLNALVNVSIPASVETIDDTAFQDCGYLSVVTIRGRKTAFGKNVFRNDSKLTIRCYKNSTAETYAKDNGIPFEVVDWVISFNPGDGSGSMENDSVIKGEKYTLPVCTFTAPEGKVFDTWDKGAPGEKIDVTADTEITALWKDKPADPAADPGSDPATPADLVNEVTVSGGVYTLNHTALTATFIRPENKNAKKLTIEDTVSANGSEYSVTAVKSKACRKMKKLTTLTIGINVTKIGSKAFSECGKLKTITIKCPNMKKSGFGSKCFFRIKSGAKFKVPKAAYKNYKKWIASKGKAPGNSKFKKVK